jgi:hypothetical protein
VRPEAASWSHAAHTVCCDDLGAELDAACVGLRLPADGDQIPDDRLAGTIDSGNRTLLQDD